jgi:AraC family transcriptional regulator, transcriptional activator of pobA
MSNFFKIESISQIHELIGYAHPKHPLITLFESSKMKTQIPEIKEQIISSLYSISLKNGSECQLIYGRQNYDFQEGSLMFLAPEQVMIPIQKKETREQEHFNGWTLAFHPDLIRKSVLGQKMKEYTFFSYSSNEALHVSEQERETVSNIVKIIEHEYSQNLDDHSHELIISNLELLFNYCKRFYGRQFITRTNENKDIVIRFEEFLKSYFESENPELLGLPTVKYCAQEIGYSPNYLSDLLKKETGKNSQEHIYFHLIEKAKNMLLGSEEPVYTIAYSLGFEYPQHFSKLFKSKTGMSPAEYRN